MTSKTGFYGVRRPSLRGVYEALVHPEELDRQGGSWQLPRAVANKRVIREFLQLCRREGVKAKHCAKDLVETV